MVKNELIAEGERLIGKVKKRDIFHLEGIEPHDVMDDSDLNDLKKWLKAVDLFSYSITDQRIKDRIDNLWVYNHNRVNIDNIKLIVSLLKLNL